MGTDKSKQIYRSQISDALKRIHYSTEFLESYFETEHPAHLDTSILQLRKAMESIAYAAIVPNRQAYEQFRKSADESKDFRNDYNARQITIMLEKINPDFFPVPLLPAIQKSEGQWHFERRDSGFMSKKRFQKLYDRLGKFLHADNPWGNQKGFLNLANELPNLQNQLKELLVLYVTFIVTPQFNGVWVIDNRLAGFVPTLFEAEADGEFVVSEKNS